METLLASVESALKKGFKEKYWVEGWAE